MIALIIDGKPAALRRDASFQMILENREFDDRDGYSLSIELPLRECPENVAIFGHLLSSQIPIENIRLDASLWLDSWVKNGVVTIVSVGKSSVSVQFLEGRCAQNFDKTLDKIYINELELGGYGDMTNRDNITPEEAWKVVANGYYPSHVCLPWVSNSSGIKYNDAEYVGGEWVWKDPILPEDPDEETTSQDWITLEQSRKLTWQIYLMELTRRICEAVGLTPDLSKWPTKKKTLVVCNTLPPVYELYGWADILPHWSVKEFFANLEPLLQGYFDIDLRAKSIVFVPFAPEDKKLTEITPDKLIAEFSVDVSADEKSAKYRSNKNLKYADSSSDNLWPLLTCGKPLEEWPQSKVQNFGSLLAMMAWSQNYKSTDFTKAMKQRGSSTPLNRIARFRDMNFALYATRKRKGLVQYMDKYYLTWIYTNSMIQVGQFAPLIRNDRDEGDYTELQFLPVTLKPADYLTMFIPFSQMSDEKAESQFYAEGLDDEELRQNWIIEQLENEERDKQVFFDKIYVGHYAVYDAYTYDIEKYTPYPFVDNLFLKSSTTLNSPGSVIYYEQKTRYEGCSLRLKDLAEKESQLRIDPRMKYKFRFLSAQVPEVRDIFLIKGRRYVCEKLTVNFTFDGKSEIIEGEFYPVDESAAAS